MEFNTASLLLIQGGIFLIILWFLNRNLLQPVLKILHDREAKTEGFFAEAEEMRKKITAVAEGYEEKLGQAKREALELKRSVVAEGLGKRESILGEARTEAGAYLDGIRAAVAKEVETTRKVLNEEVLVLGREIAQKILGRAL
jgi:F-type H+-transporting ATPase subunit b